MPTPRMGIEFYTLKRGARNNEAEGIGTYLAGNQEIVHKISTG